MDAGLATRTYTYYAVEEGFQVGRSHYGALKLVLPNGEKTTFPLSKIETSIGRRDDQSPTTAFADIEVSTAPNVSRLHGVFRYNLMGKYLEYQDRSRQGTKINGQLAQAQTWVKVLDGDQFLLGETVLLVLETGK